MAIQKICAAQKKFAQHIIVLRNLRFTIKGRKYIGISVIQPNVLLLRKSSV